MFYIRIDRYRNEVVFQAYGITLADTDRIAGAIESVILEERDRAVRDGRHFNGEIEKKEVDGSRVIKNMSYEEEEREYE